MISNTNREIQLQYASIEGKVLKYDKFEIIFIKVFYAKKLQ